ncbi:MAG: hypothetical protein M3Z84_06430 [Actinomycetota bacterium]|nr:hypothetical protein [Actinomycetota bacterium]
MAGEGFTDFATRPQRLRSLLDAYGWNGTLDEVLDAVTARVTAHIDDVRQLAVHDPVFAQLLDSGATDDLDQALAELATDRAELITAR